MLHTSQIPTDLDVGTSADGSELYVGDFRGMYFLLRENVSIQLLREAFASTGEIGFACHVRADVVIPYPQTFAVVKGVRA
ncbi:Phage capsid family protein [compost metagenome]